MKREADGRLRFSHQRRSSLVPCLVRDKETACSRMLHKPLSGAQSSRARGLSLLAERASERRRRVRVEERKERGTRASTRARSARGARTSGRGKQRALIPRTRECEREGDVQCKALHCALLRDDADEWDLIVTSSPTDKGGATEGQRGARSAPA